MIHGRGLRIAALLLLAVVVGTSGDDQAEKLRKTNLELEILDDVRMELEYYPNGKVKSRLIAKRARIPEEEQEDVQAWGVRAEFYDETEKLEIVILAENCIYNRRKQEISSKARVRIEKKDVVISGTGFRWSSETERVKVRKDAKVILARGLELGKVVKK